MVGQDSGLQGNTGGRTGKSYRDECCRKIKGTERKRRREGRSSVLKAVDRDKGTAEEWW